MPRLGNLFDDAIAPAEGERFESVYKGLGVHVERIVSSLRPDTSVYDQPHAEWVVLLRGTAVLEVEGEATSLTTGDHVFLPAHARHRVLKTSEGALWLAVHLPRTEEGS